jgi:hypothetical protein
MFHHRARDHIKNKCNYFFVYFKDNICICNFILLKTPLLLLKLCIVIRYMIEIFYLFTHLPRYGLFNDAFGSSNNLWCTLFVRNIEKQNDK